MFKMMLLVMNMLIANDGAAVAKVFALGNLTNVFQIILQLPITVVTQLVGMIVLLQSHNIRKCIITLTLLVIFIKELF